MLHIYKFIHTDWYGTTVDENLIDAFLLGAKRIGHGYAIPKHPVILNALKPRDICLEVCPISNQVLHLVQDLRNHPATILTAENIPFVISNDDPSFWNAKGLSYDFYYAFMSFSPQDAGLAYLKQLVWNSLKLVPYIYMDISKFKNYILKKSFLL